MEINHINILREQLKKQDLDIDGYVARDIFPIQEKLKENLIFEDERKTVFTNVNKPLSKGCQSCKTGTWLCIFVGSRCNLSCDFCPQANKGVESFEKLMKNETADSFATGKIEDIKREIELHGNTLIKGVSYSGGEPFLYLEKILDCAAHAKKYGVYQWIYTNGTYATKENLQQLYDAGITEIRFDLAATKFSKKVMNKLKIAREIMDVVTIEVPSTNETLDYLIRKDFISKLEEIKIDQLNLAELFLNENNSKNYTDEKKYSVNLTNSQIINFKNKLVKENPESVSSLLSGRVNTYKIIEYALEKKVSYVINDCSNETKDLQVSTRQNNPVMKKLYGNFMKHGYSSQFTEI